MRRHEFQHYFERSPEDPPPIEVSVTRRLQFSESDPLGIAWHGNYSKFFEAAYTELSHRCGFDNDRLEEEHVSALFYTDRYDYRIPLRCDAVFRTTTAIVWTEAPRINIEYSVHLEDGRLAGVKRVKYLRLVTPDMPVSLTLTLEPGETEGTWSANASLVNGDGGRVSAAKLIFADKESKS